MSDEMKMELVEEADEAKTADIKENYASVSSDEDAAKEVFTADGKPQTEVNLFDRESDKETILNEDSLASNAKTHNSVENTILEETLSDDFKSTVDESSHTEKKFKLEKITVKTSNKITLPKKKHTTDKPYRCDICKSTFQKPYDLKVHARTHTGEKPYRCEVCDNTFTQASSLKVHMRIHTGEKPYKCSYCNSAFNQATGLKTHLRTHTGEKPYKCYFCDSAFSQSYDMRVHLRIHTGEKPFKCAYCFTAFTQESALKIHLRKHTGEKPYKCKGCDAAFTNSSGLKRHLRKHSGEKPYKCEYCGHHFALSSGLKRHLRTHTGEKPYKCDFCSATFTSGGSLTEHIRLHTGEKPYICEICNAAYTHQKSLKIHIRLHTGEKPYKCDLCDAAFSYSRDIKKHKALMHATDEPNNTTDSNTNLTSTGEVTNQVKGCSGEKIDHKYKNSDSITSCNSVKRRSGKHCKEKMDTDAKTYKCGICSKAFFDSVDLVDHFKIHSGAKLYKCQFCKAAFSDSHDLTLHLLMHTEEQQPNNDIDGDNDVIESGSGANHSMHAGEETTIDDNEPVYNAGYELNGIQSYNAETDSGCLDLRIKIEKD